MSEEYRSKVFKSGNSLALRLPKGLRIKEGTEMRVREEQGHYIAEPVDAPKRKIDLAGIWGACPELKPLTPEERVFEHSPRVWDNPDWSGWKDDVGA